MPKQKRPRLNFYKKTQRTVTPVKQQCCVVCYTEFYPFPITPSKWESCLTKLFYSAMDIPLQSEDGEEGDDDDAVVSLPYCPQCHTKIAIMFNLRCQLESIQHQYECVRNEIAFLVVETITQNCRNGPMDFIRQQIFEKWRDYHESEKAKDDYGMNIGLDAAMFVGYRHNENEEVASVNVSNNDDPDLITVKTENISNNEESHHEASSHEEFDDSVASMMELEMKDGVDYENQIQQQLHFPPNTPLAPNAIHTLPAKSTTKYSQPRNPRPVTTIPADGLESPNFVHTKMTKHSQRVPITDQSLFNDSFETDAEAAAVAAESVRGFTRVATVRGRGSRGGGASRRGLLPSSSPTNGYLDWDAGARAVAAESVKTFTRVTTIRGRGRGRRGFGTMPRLIRMGDQSNQSATNTSAESPLKFFRGRGSRGRGGGTPRSRSSGSESVSTSNSASPTKVFPSNNSIPGKVDGLSCRVCKKKFPYATLLKLHFLTHEKNLSSHSDTDGLTEGTR